MNDLVPAEHSVPANTFPVAREMQSALGGANVGAVSIEQERAVAEAQGQLILAKRFPRSMPASITEFLDSCKSPDFAQSAFYTVPNRGSGPSIRFAEEAARCYGNFQYGHRELSRSDGKSEIEVYAWDMERNNRSTRQITVMHVRDKAGGAVKLTDQGDIDNRIANIASKQIRGRILALLAKSLVAAGIAECRRTLAGDNEKPVSQRIVDMSVTFSRKGVTVAMLEGYLKHPLDQTTTDELADLQGVYNAIKEGVKASEYFSANSAEADHADRLAGGASGDKKTEPAKPAAQRQAKQTTPKEEPKDGPKDDAKTGGAPAAEASKEAPKPDDEGVDLMQALVKAEKSEGAESETEVKTPAADDEAVF